MRFSVIPSCVSIVKKPAPPSSAYLPASSATPKVVLDAAPARASAAHADARTAEIRLMLVLSADQPAALSTASRSFPAPNRTGSSAGRPVSVSAAAIAARAFSSETGDVLRQMQATLAGRSFRD